ncbi:hypothetical protein ACVW01_002276 [Thermostichus sp. MS-CIW-19]|jgi:hypothetical protein|nr:hypothetical protein SYN63AY4M2_10470 [Synechococcus sp. 63AY4M2]PIK89632.1 hypothetical protein SYN65AY6A5_00730 [Synechococcus sp. 65AY6A5]PIK93201.1 hypothetical protein SYN65AY6LI_07965 [Synechococcus sp. 65AY6Li]PIK96511.1 hypothetical protein SYN60AY4M2_11085 [Synechococcus sp. 60AY4M2]PIK99113.1 hypothetical protein SYN63AY4M1_08500 [Synechococcus sp. 63AY4M1]PIL02447.1 hypothetical protein SYN65AY640_05590 [Synechococcus sp. 65AY640]
MPYSPLQDHNLLAYFCNQKLGTLFEATFFSYYLKWFSKGERLSSIGVQSVFLPW